MLARTVRPLLLVAFTAVALGLRLLAAPGGDSIRAAVAPAPDGRAYEATAAGVLNLVGPGAERSALGRLPTRSPLALAAGDVILLGAADGLFIRTSGGSWRRAPVPGRHFLAVAASGSRLAAASWAGKLWLSDDSGAGWRAATLPASATEVTAISLGSPDAVGTLTGVLTSVDGGISWTSAEGVPGRITALDRQGSALLAAAWDGRLYGNRPGAPWSPEGVAPAGVWALSAPAGAVATIAGLQLAGINRLPGREVSGLVLSAGNLYAFEPGGAVTVFKP